LIEIQKEEKKEKRRRRSRRQVTEAFQFKMISSSGNLTTMTTLSSTIKSIEKRLKIDNNDTETDINNNIPSNINTKISNTFEAEKNETRITQADKIFLGLKQELLAQDFLKKHAYNDNLYIFPNIYKIRGKKCLFS
jgi:hypothetical protein